MGITPGYGDHSKAINAISVLEERLEDAERASNEIQENIRLLDEAREKIINEVQGCVPLIDSKISQLQNTKKEIQNTKVEIEKSLEKFNSNFYLLIAKIFIVAIGLGMVVGISLYAYSLLQNRQLEQAKNELEQAQEKANDFAEFIFYIYQGDQEKASISFQKWKAQK